MVNAKEKFLIDSNSFITPYRFYYAFDLIPSYWEELARHTEAGRIILLDMVKKEIEQGKDALNAWSQATVADPWLIAAAAVNGYTIISDEASAGTLSIKNQSKNAKIPDVAKNFGVKSKPLFYMMRQLGIKI